MGSGDTKEFVKMDHTAYLGRSKEINAFGGNRNMVLGQFMPIRKHSQLFFYFKRCIVIAGVTSWEVSNLRI